VIEEVEVVAIPGRDMQRLMGEHPGIAVKLNAALAQRLRATNERLARQSFQTVQSRVAAVLAQMVAAARGDGAGDGDVVVALTQADLAKLAGSSRESASRFLATLERSGVITQGRGRLTVHDPAALEGYVY
jgi:CRP/FNR family transcriptional regulator